MTTIWIAQTHSCQRHVASLVRAGLPDVRVVVSHSGDREDIFMEADASLAEPAHVAPDEYSDWMLETAKSLSAKLVLAARHRTSLAGRRGDFAAAGIRLCCGAETRESLEIASDKARFTALLDASGLPTPRTALVRDADEMARAIADEGCAGPVCVKPCSGVFGRGFWRLRDDAPAFGHLVGATEVNTAAFVAAYGAATVPEPFLVMEWLPGDESSVDMVCDRGAVVAAAARTKKQSHQIVDTGGEAVDLARAVAALLRLDGIVNVQTRIGADGRMRVLEVNARPAGGVGYSAAAGVNLPGVWASHGLGRASPSPRLASPAAIRVVERPVVLPLKTAALAPLRVA